MAGPRASISPLHHAGAPALLLFGGSFDPPHAAHTQLAGLARERLAQRLGERVRLILVPAARSPHKHEAPAPDADRLAMLRLASAGLDDAAIWTDEIDRASHGHPEPSYWVQTLRRAHAASSRVKLFFLIGADQALSFHRWREPRAILALARPVVLPRDPVLDRGALLEALRADAVWTGDELGVWSEAWLELPTLPHAATQVRELLLAGEDAGALLHPEVAAYIRQRGLYRSVSGTGRAGR